MRVLQAMAGAEYGGAEAFFERLILALHKEGVEQKALIRKNPGRAERLRTGGVDPVQLPFGNKFDFKTGWIFKKQIRTFKPDIVLTWMNRATDKCPVGDFVHVARLGGYYDLKYYQACDHLVGNTRDIVGYLARRGVGEERVHYLPNFVSEKKGQPIGRKKLHTPRDVPLIVALGRLHANKAFDTLFRAVQRLSDVYVWLAGEGPEKDTLETLSEELGVRPRIRFLGWRNDVENLLASADLFVCPSRHEPLGNVVLEAWAQGLPVIAADSIGPGTLIEHLKNGMLTPVDDHRSMAEAIRHMLKNQAERERMAKAGRDVFRASFTEAAVVQAYLDFFRKVMR